MNAGISVAARNFANAIFVKLSDEKKFKLLKSGFLTTQEVQTSARFF